MVMNAWKISNVVVVGTHMTVVRMVLGSVIDANASRAALCAN